MNLDAGPIVVIRKPEVAEAVRVMTPVVLRQTGMLIWRGLLALAGVLMIVFGVALLIPQKGGDPLFGTMFFIFGALLLVVPVYSVRAMVRRQIVAGLKTGPPGIWTISDAGLDVEGAHSRAHFDWSALSDGRRIPEGIVFRIGRLWTYVALREFESDADFERALLFFRTGLGAKFAV